MKHLFDIISQESPSSIAIIYDDGKDIRSVNYEEILQLSQIIENLIPINSGLIAVNVPKDELYPSIIIGIMKSGCGFFNTSTSSSLSDLLKRVPINFFIVEKQTNTELKCEVEITEFQFKSKQYVLIDLRNRRKINLDQFSPFKYAYMIETSGTTKEEKKLVLVPHAAIVPNITDFIKILELSTDDVSLGASPLSFDPHIVDLFATLGAGGKLIYVPSSLLLSPPWMERLWKFHSITSAQLTPSVFKSFGVKVIRKILGEETTKRIVFGGEPCIDKCDLITYIPNTRKSSFDFYNVYGITEVSCWASIEKIDLNLPNEPISLGVNLSQTELLLNDNGNILIKSKERKCAIIGEPDTTIFNTGDLGRIVNGKFFYEGREDRMIKWRGSKLNLCTLQNCVISTGHFSFVYAYVDNSLILVLKRKETQNSRFLSSKSLLSYLRQRVSPNSIPNRIHYIHGQLPLTLNGKVDLRKIKLDFSSSEMQEIREELDEKTIKKLLKDIWSKGLSVSLNLIDSNSNFLELGGDSIKARHILEDLFISLNLFGTKVHYENEATILQGIFTKHFSWLVSWIFQNISTSIILSQGEIKKGNLKRNLPIEFHDAPISPSPCKFLKKRRKSPKESLVLCEENVKREESNFEELFTNIEVAECWDYFLGMCVDASPTIACKNSSLFGEVCLIGSQGGSLIALNLTTLKESFNLEESILWRLEFGERIEGEVAISNDQFTVFMGLGNGKLIALNFLTGKKIWEYETSGPIRSSPQISFDGKILYFSNSANSIFALSTQNGRKLWEKQENGISTISPLVSSQSLFYIREGKTLLSVDRRNGEFTKWKTTLTSVLTPPSLMKLNGIEIIGFGTREGKYETHNVQTGLPFWTFDCKDEGEYKRGTFHKCESNQFLLLPKGKNLNVLNPINGKILWKWTGESEVNSISSIAHIGNECCGVVGERSGIVWLLPLLTSLSPKCLRNQKMKDFNFSSPVLSSDIVTFGGRDNSLHILLLNTD